MFAEAHAPFPDSGTLILRAPFGAAIWYWDNSLVEPAARGRVVPETVLHTPGEGWRVVACYEGFEAQYWQDGALLASTWRRSPFTREQWAAFALSVEGAGLGPPDTPPAPVDAAIRANTNWRSREITAAGGWRTLSRAAIAGSFVSAATAAFAFGQGLQISELLKKDNEAQAAIASRLERDPGVGSKRDNLAMLREYRDAMAGTDVLSATADAFEVFQKFGLKVSDWSVDQTKFKATLNAKASEIPLREIISTLEDKDMLCQVTPRVTNGDGGIEITATVGASSEAASCIPNKAREVPR